MTLQSSGVITASDIRTEGKQSGLWDINDPVERKIAKRNMNSGENINFSDFYGKQLKPTYVRYSFGAQYYAQGTYDGNGNGDWTFIRIKDYFPFIEPGDPFSFVVGCTAGFFGYPQVFSSAYQYQVSAGSSDYGFNLASRGYSGNGWQPGHGMTLMTYYGGANNNGLEAVGVGAHYGYGGSRSGKAIPNHWVLGITFGVQEEGALPGISSIGDYPATYAPNVAYTTIGDDRNGNFPYWPGGYFSPSDYRIKTDVQAINDAIERLQKLNPVKFAFTSAPDVMVDGFIAHEVAEVVPEAVIGEKDAVDIQQLDQSRLVPVLTAALQQAVKQIAQLEARVANLESVA